MSFANLKRNSKNNFEKLNKELSKLASNNFNKEDDEHIWKLNVDKAGNGSAIIRFLPEPEGEDFPFVRIWDHGFQGPGGWYIEKSLTTLGQDDPLGEYNSTLWNSGLESDKEQARKQKRRLKYWANIYVIKDPANPEREGKVYLFPFGKKIFDKLNDLMNPQFDDEEAVNPFDFWHGANFRLKQRKVDGWPNYDKSEFDSPEPLFDDDDKLEEVYGQLHSLQALLDPKNFKTYDELKKRLDRVLGLNDSPTRRADPEPEERQRPQREAPQKEEAEDSNTWDEDDDDLDFFNSLMESDDD